MARGSLTLFLVYAAEAQQCGLDLIFIPAAACHSVKLLGQIRVFLASKLLTNSREREREGGRQE